MNVSDLTPAQLRQAADLKEKIVQLEKQFAQIERGGGGQNNLPLKSAKPIKRKITAAARAKIAAVAKACWEKGLDAKLLTSGSWNGDDSLIIQGGQAMIFHVKNVNVLGTTIQIADTKTGDTKQSIIAPQQTVTLEFDKFGAEPMEWNFKITSLSDAFIVTWQLFSTWVPGDPPNP